MKRIFTLTVAALLFAGSAMAQDTAKKEAKGKAGKEFKKEHRQGRHHKHDGAAMAKELNLTEAQKEQFKSLHKEYKSKAQALKQERKSKTENILTAEQKAKLADLKEKRKDKVKQRGGDVKQRGGDRAEGLKKDLNLTEAQGQKIKAMNEEFRTKAKAIRENSSLTQEQKKEQFKALSEEHKASMKSVLTAEQLQKMEAKRSQFKEKRNK